jgi:hypothetical protein
MAPFTIIHNLDGLDKEAIKKYLADMSAYISLDPNLNGLDTIYMNDPQGGRALVPYARRGTCEILRNLYEVQVDSLTYATVNGSIVFTATGRSAKRGNRQEVAIGSKYVEGLKERALDNAIMTASTRALQRLTMQFTELGILAESEVVDLVGQTPNPAGSAQLASNPVPPIFLPPPSVPANNAPGKPVEPTSEPKAAPAPPVDLAGPSISQIAATQTARRTFATPPQYPDAPTSASVHASVKTFPGNVEDEIGLPKEVAPATPTTEPSPADSTTSNGPEAAPKAAKKTRKTKNTVALDVEPEVVQAPKPEPAAPTQVDSAVSTQVNSVPAQVNPAAQVPASESASVQVTPSPVVAQAAPIAGMPSKEQMDEYRKKISVYTVQLPPSQDLGPTQKMRAFITKLSDGTPPQSMTVDQWEEVIAFINGFMERNQGNVKNLVTYINDMLGVK